MSPQTKVRILAGLALALAVIVFFNFQGGGVPATPGAAAAEAYRPIAVENPALHLDRIERLRKLEYHPSGRDIFTAELPPPPAPKPPPGPPPGPPLPPPEPALVVPFKFYGFSADARTGKRRGFFTNGEDVFIVSEGELVLGRFRVLSIGNTVAEVEEVSSTRRAKLTMESPGGTPPA